MCTVQAAETLHTPTQDTFLFLYGVSECEENYRVALNYLN